MSIIRNQSTKHHSRRRLFGAALALTLALVAAPARAADTTSDARVTVASAK